MTRINCVPVSELTDKHLGAEYRELPRVFALSEAAWLRGQDPSKFPSEYTLGTGHVTFFYVRLGWLRARYYELVAECLKRGRKVAFPHPPDPFWIPDDWYADWTPTKEALAINRARIRERLN